MTLENYYLFIYFYKKFKTENYLQILKSLITDKLKIDNIDFDSMTEQIFEQKYNSYIELNSLCQAIDINFEEFVK